MIKKLHAASSEGLRKYTIVKRDKENIKQEIQAVIDINQAHQSLFFLSEKSKNFDHLCQAHDSILHILAATRS